MWGLHFQDKNVTTENGIKTERSLFTQGGGAVQIRKSRALKICPPSEVTRYVFAPPWILRTKILPPLTFHARLYSFLYVSLFIISNLYCYKEEREDQTWARGQINVLEDEDEDF